MRKLAGLIFGGVAGLWLSGCNFTPYGAAAPYSYFAERKILVTMPAIAPTITKQFRTLPDQSATHDPEGEHLGLDVLEKVGTPVLAAAGGTVIRSYLEPMYGNRVAVQHGVDSEGLPLTTVYKHLDQREVRADDNVRRGQKIGTLGTTGLLSQSHPHLHFEVWQKTSTGFMQAVDPQLLWTKGVGRVTCFKRGRYYRKSPVKMTYPVQCK